MEIALTLLGVVIGSGVTLVGQIIVRRREERERWAGVMLETCAIIYRLEDEFMSSVTRAFRQPFYETDRYKRWSRSDRAHAAARLRLVSDCQRLHDLDSRLRDSGRTIMRLAQQDGTAISSAEVKAWSDQHEGLLDEFMSVARGQLQSGSLRM